MKVYLEKPTHRLSLQITSKARELGILYGPKSIISNRPSRKHLIVIANGSPDNIVLVLLAYLLNHSTIVDMVFPMYKHISILDHVVEYIGRGYENIMVVIDQEELDLERISGILARKFPRISRVDDRLLAYGIVEAVGMHY